MRFAFRRLKPGFVSSVVTSLLIVTVLAMTAHRVGILDTSWSVLGSNKLLFTAVTADPSSLTINPSESKAEANCLLSDSPDYRYCTLVIFLHEDGSQGVDLSVYDSVTVDLDYRPSTPGAQVRIYLRNFNPKYSKITDDSSAKFNELRYSPAIKGARVRVPLSAFQVPNWWIDQYAVGFDDGQRELTNVNRIEFSSPDNPKPGEYHIKVKEVTFHGQRISEANLIRVLFLLWLATALVLLNRQRKLFEHLSNTDMLCGIANRRGLRAWVKNHVPPDKCNKLTVMYIDIDNFKTVNTNHGHYRGDQLLQAVSDRIGKTNQKFLRKNKLQGINYFFARLSGDEFCLVYIGLAVEHYGELAQCLLESARQPIDPAASNIATHISIGIANNIGRDCSVEDTMRRADAALLHAKTEGKNQYKIFDQKLADQLEYRREISLALRMAIAKNEFSLVFMPIYRCATQQICGGEVLIRCNSPELAGVGPDTYIPIAEEFGLIEEIDLWVFENSLKHIANVKKEATEQAFIFSINISAVELHNTNFVSQIKNLLDLYEVPPELIELEITETSLVDKDERTVQVLEDLKNIGVSVALDDYGTGFTAFNQLTVYPIDCLKIDRSFVSGNGKSYIYNKMMVDIIMSISESYGFRTIAEGVESEEQLKYLNNLNCEFAQGYLLSKPVTWQEFITLLNLTHAA